MLQHDSFLIRGSSRDVEAIAAASDRVLELLFPPVGSNTLVARYPTRTRGSIPIRLAEHIQVLEGGQQLLHHSRDSGQPAQMDGGFS